MERDWIYFIGFPFCQLEMQALLPQPSEACKAYLDSNVQEAAQEGMWYFTQSTFLYKEFHSIIVLVID
jgi:hypothetical protein